MVYPTLDVDAWLVAGVETDGRTEHVWLERPGDDRLWLFKKVVVHDDHRQGEDWVEKLSSVFAGVLGVPHADVDLARREGAPGCVVRDVKPHQWQLYSGADLLTGLLGPTFDPRDRWARGHNLENVREVLRDHGPPPGTGLEGSAFDCFAGFLVLDALIGNRDRHPRNWAVMQPPGGGSRPDALCPAYDHASGLGFGLQDAERDRWLRERGVEVWAQRGTAKSFEHGRKPWPSLVGVALESLRTSSAPARARWRAGVVDVRADVVEAAVHDVPGLSEVCRRFTAAVVSHNRARLLEESW